MNKYHKILKSWEVPCSKSEEHAWGELQSRLTMSKKKETRVVSFSWKPLISVAAAAAIIVAIVLLWPENNLIRKETAFQSTERFVLPDMSVVYLNAGSAISYDEDWSKERTLMLDGQAFFEVVKGGKFSVVTQNGVIEVLGTSFDVYARNKDFRVECFSGKVRVSAGKGHVDITPGNAALLEGNSLSLSKFDLNQADWRMGEFVYESEPLMNVFDELERQFNVTIVAPKLNDRLYTGRFNVSELSKALELICLPMALRYEIEEDNQVVVSEMAR